MGGRNKKRPFIGTDAVAVRSRGPAIALVVRLLNIGQYSLRAGSAALAMGGCLQMVPFLLWYAESHAC